MLKNAPKLSKRELQCLLEKSDIMSVPSRFTFHVPWSLWWVCRAQQTARTRRGLPACRAYYTSAQEMCSTSREHLNKPQGGSNLLGYNIYSHDAVLFKTFSAFKRDASFLRMHLEQHQSVNQEWQYCNVRYIHLSCTRNEYNHTYSHQFKHVYCFFFFIILHDYNYITIKFIFHVFNSQGCKFFLYMNTCLAITHIKTIVVCNTKFKFNFQLFLFMEIVYIFFFFFIYFIKKVKGFWLTGFWYIYHAIPVIAFPLAALTKVR